MKFCSNCHITYDDDANVCAQCGAPLMSVPEQPRITDHTAEFNPMDISDNKVIAMIPYLFGWIGIIITLIASGSSPYAAFHVKQALKIQVISAISIVLVFIPILGWIAMGIWAIVTFVIDIICFIKVCQGKAEEPPIINRIGFLK